MSTYVRKTLDASMRMVAWTIVVVAAFAFGTAVAAPLALKWNGGASGNGFSTSFLEEGDNEVRIRVDFGGINYSKEMTLRIVPYGIEGSDEIYRGQSTVYSVVEYDIFKVIVFKIITIPIY